ncbi:hypothetical protein GCM10010503_02350 [Streptomyces lucensis JCM 4490]|uniref:Integral membrane protein n=1 Tax=Streptomyces lucensis JCM 4490 TaxID=1306176 RepID=A0A918MK41_9ACTN|nr:hypothetical protein [Streptomyces lucensis]GGW30335.1 hypothetical protein GCM10010503_02350 [Streptomyces lucensis JCM 4490]
MPDRSLRLLTFPPRPVQGGEGSAVLLRERPASPPEAPRGGRDGEGRGGEREDDNPFAPPPEGAPDRPWQPRHPGSPGPGPDGSSGHGPQGGSGHGSEGGPGSNPGGYTPWGGQWSDRQPGRSPGGFGQRPGGGPQGPGGPAGPGTRWDPADPAQRHARFALLSGMWAVFFVLFSWPYVSLLLGALAMYWGISALRAKPRTPDPDTPAAPSGRPQTTAAVSGLVTASLALIMVASTFTVQLVYRDYYTCVDDALTHEAKQSCDRLLPSELRGVLGVGND